MTIKCQCFTKLFDFILPGFRKDTMEKSYIKVNKNNSPFAVLEKLTIN